MTKANKGMWRMSEQKGLVGMLIIMMEKMKKEILVLPHPSAWGMRDRQGRLGLAYRCACVRVAESRVPPPPQKKKALPWNSPTKMDLCT